MHISRFWKIINHFGLIKIINNSSIDTENIKKSQRKHNKTYLLFLIAKPQILSYDASNDHLQKKKKKDHLQSFCNLKYHQINNKKISKKRPEVMVHNPHASTGQKDQRLNIVNKYMII